MADRRPPSRNTDLVSLLWRPEMIAAGNTRAFSKLLGTRVIAALIAVIGFLSFHQVLGYSFTGTDTLTLIDTSRIHSPADLERIFFEPLMGRSQFAERAGFYRPIASLSYSLDHALWGTDPFGYHLTDLLLHAAVAFLLVIFIGAVTNGDRTLCLAAGLLFVTHPVLVESVPAPALRHDVMAAAFMLLSLILLVRGGVDPTRGGRFRVASVLLYALALGTKEMAVFFPCLVAWYLFVFSSGRSILGRLGLAAKGSAAYVLVTLGYLAWRTEILGGLGGYGDQPSGLGAMWEQARAIVGLYLVDAVYPHDFLDITDSYPRFFLVVLVVMVGGLGAFLGRAGWAEFAQKQDGVAGRLGTVLFVWLSLPLAVCVLSATFSHRSMYNAVIPLSALVATALVTSVRSARVTWSSMRNRSLTGICGSDVRGCAVQGLVCCLSLALGASLLAYSPLVRNYGEVEDSAKMSSMFFERLARIVPSIPSASTVHIYNLPSSIMKYESLMPRAKEVGYLNDYSIKSWLDLFYPGNRLNVKVHSRFKPDELPRDLDLTVTTQGRTTTRLFVSAKQPQAKQAVASQHSLGRPLVAEAESAPKALARMVSKVWHYRLPESRVENRKFSLFPTMWKILSPAPWSASVRASRQRIPILR